MTERTDAQNRYIYSRWQETIVGRDLNGLMALYADDAIRETPLILVTLTELAGFAETPFRFV